MEMLMQLYGYTVILNKRPKFPVLKANKFPLQTITPDLHKAKKIFKKHTRKNIPNYKESLLISH